MKFAVHKAVRLDYKKKHLQETLQLPELFKQKRRLFSRRKKTGIQSPGSQAMYLCHSHVERPLLKRQLCRACRAISLVRQWVVLMRLARRVFT